MKYLIAVLITLQIGFTPFCAVLAKEFADDSTNGQDCVMMDTGTEEHLSHHSPSLICCTTGAAQQSSIQPQLFLDTNTQAIQVDRTTYTNQQIFLDTDFLHSNTKHPPDDFERCSRSKRE